MADEQGDGFEADIPEYFFTTKWPHPKLRNNQPTGKDEALEWFMDYHRDDIEEHVDLRRLNKKQRLDS